MNVFNRPVWTPEPKELRFLQGIGVLSFLIMPLWGKGWLHFMGHNPVMLLDVVAWTVYLLIFEKRLRHRDELGRVIFVPAAFFALLELGVRLV